MHTNHLGSLNCFTSESGALEQEMSFDSLGRRRNPTNWSYTGVPTTHIIDRGYTGHEHLDGFGLINMNGRMYDPVTGRFLSPDNQVQAPDNTQSYNRYTYCLNNPLKYTDPSGWGEEPKNALPWESDPGWRPNGDYSPPAGADGLTNQQWMYSTNPAQNNPDYQQMVAFNQENKRIMAGVAQYVREHNSFTLSINGVSLGRVYVKPGNSVNIDFDFGDQSGRGDLLASLDGGGGLTSPSYKANFELIMHSNRDALKQYIAIVVGESGNNFYEAAGIGSVIVNRLINKGATLNGNFVSKIGGDGEYDAIGGSAYNTIMKSSWEDILSTKNIYSTRIEGALQAVFGDYSNRAYFWNASSPRTGFNWDCYNKGIYTITNSVGGTTFFRYTDITKHYP